MPFSEEMVLKFRLQAPSHHINAGVVMPGNGLLMNHYPNLSPLAENRSTSLTGY